MTNKLSLLVSDHPDHVCISTCANQTANLETLWYTNIRTLNMLARSRKLIALTAPILHPPHSSRTHRIHPAHTPHTISYLSVINQLIWYFNSIIGQVDNPICPHLHQKGSLEIKTTQHSCPRSRLHSRPRSNSHCARLGQAQIAASRRVASVRPERDRETNKKIAKPISDLSHFSNSLELNTCSLVTLLIISLCIASSFHCYLFFVTLVSNGYPLISTISSLVKQSQQSVP